ncbi:hypothetical protein D3C78_1699770 [compost metagenome]
MLARYVRWGGLANAFPERMLYLGSGSQHLGNFGKVVVRGLTGTLALTRTAITLATMPVPKRCT